MDLISKKLGIYKLTNKINNKIYIGKSNNLYRRMIEHKSSRIKTTPLSYAIKKYGWHNFEIEILSEFDKIDNLELLALEVAFIYFFNSTNRKIGYNILIFNFDRTGMRYKHTEETKFKIQKSNTGKIHSIKTRQKISESHKGKRLSEETKIKMSLSHMGSKNPNYHKTPPKHVTLSSILKCSKSVKQIEILTDKIIKIWPSISSAACNIGKPHNKSEISRACKNKTHTALGFKWELAD